MSTWVAGIDKPHRCPQCWGCSWGYGENWRSGWADSFWRFVKYLPRRCGKCNALTLTTSVRRVHGIQLKRATS